MTMPVIDPHEEGLSRLDRLDNPDYVDGGPRAPATFAEVVALLIGALILAILTSGGIYVLVRIWRAIL